MNAKITGRAAEDIVLFTGNGTTAAVNKLVIALGINVSLPQVCSSCFLISLHQDHELIFLAVRLRDTVRTTSQWYSHHSMSTIQISFHGKKHTYVSKPPSKIQFTPTPFVFFGHVRREAAADVITIAYCPQTGVCLQDLDCQLKRFQSRRVKIGAFSAASNVTGADCSAVVCFCILILTCPAYQYI